MIRLSIVMAALCGLSSYAFADLVVIGNRSNSGLSSQLCEKLAGSGLSVDGHCSLAIDQSKEFGDGSTFVQLNSPLYGAEALVVVPSLYSNADHFMEGLMKIRTAKGMGAKAVFTFSSPPLSGFELQLAAKAGAEQELTLNPGDGSLVRKTLVAPAPVQRVHDSQPVSLANAVLFSRTTGDFDRNLRESLGILRFDNELRLKEHLRLAPGSVGKTVLIVSQWTTVGGNFRLFSDLKLIRDLENAARRQHFLPPHIALLVPYLPYARGDKVDHPGTTVSGRLIADLIESVEPNLVAFARLHAAQSQGFFTIPSVHVPGRKTINAQLKPLDLQAIISPDAGFQKEASRYADDLGLPVIVLNKQRDFATGQTHIKTIGDLNLKGLKVAIIDDETASGGTLANSADYLKAQGAEKVYAVVTHLTGNATKAVECASLEKVFVTDTLTANVAVNPKLVILDIAAEFAAELKNFLGQSGTPCAARLGVQ